MRRRDFITGIAGSAVAWPRAAHAQRTSRLSKIGILSGFTNPVQNNVLVEAFKQRLHELGWVEGRNVAFDYRQVGDPGRLAMVAKDIVAAQPDVILVMPTPALQAIWRTTRTIPVVFCNVSDPVEGGFIVSLARPEGNATGFTAFEYSIGGKWLELLKEFVPTITRVLVLYMHDNYTSRGLLQFIQSAGLTLGITVTAAPVKSAEDIRRAFGGFGGTPGGGLLTPPHPVITNNSKIIFELAEANRIAAVYPFRTFALAGGLASYGNVEADAYYRAAGYVDRILKGTKPRDLPVQNPTKFEFAVNLRAARAIGLEIPPSLLLRADEVIE